jgi:glycosyltransferase involved in cell wall biosynthesis
MNDEIALSVVMATYNRAEIIRETLQHLAEQDLDPTEFEVIVVDDGSPDHTRAVVEEWIPQAPFRLTYLHHENHGPGYTQNRGIEMAKAPLVLLIADDILLEPHAVGAHLETHRDHPEPEVAVLGRVEESPLLTSQSVFRGKWDHFQFSRFSGVRELPYYRFWACNISVKKDFVLRHGPYLEHRGRAGAAAHEDPQLGYQLSRAGLRILWCPEALGFHYQMTSFEEACKRRYMQGLNFGEFHQHAPAPEIPVAYHVLNWRTLSDHLRAVFGPRRRYLEGPDRNPALLVLRHLARAVLFNGVIVSRVWEPLIRAAEHNSAIARVMNAQLYRGVLFYHFLRGCRDGYRKFDRPRGSIGRAQPSPR